jgi:hypothetical protein
MDMVLYQRTIEWRVRSQRKRIKNTANSNNVSAFIRQMPRCVAHDRRPGAKRTGLLAQSRHLMFRHHMKANSKCAVAP